MDFAKESVYRYVASYKNQQQFPVNVLIFSHFIQLATTFTQQQTRTLIVPLGEICVLTTTTLMKMMTTTCPVRVVPPPPKVIQKSLLYVNPRPATNQMSGYLATYGALFFFFFFLSPFMMQVHFSSAACVCAHSRLDYP